MNLEEIWLTMKPGLVSIPGKLVASLLVVFAVNIVNKLLHYIIDRSLDTKIMNHDIVAQNIRAKTLRSILRSITTYTLNIFALLYIVTVFVGPLGLTLTSIGGVALGFGAQSFVKDIIAGIFILMEDKFKIGEYISIGSHQGTVEDIGLRTTVLRDFNGDMHIIPNGNIQEVTNVSRGDRRFMVDILISEASEIEQAALILQDVAEDFKKSHDNLLNGPSYIGVVNNRDIGATLRVQGRAEYEYHWAYENDLRQNILKRLTEAGIKTGVKLYSEGGMVK
ncbi:MAG: mechanosensitive ion channel [Clostridium sp.]|nr:mechanosensitive ion channel [Clostridium sp.]